ncbi:MAG: hypothetical protein QNJ64_20985 [Crocosphaera sp.]|nr:hypothetical protein [Crocosphaera sp.]
MIVISNKEIEALSSRLSTYPEAIKALNTIKECDGYLEDAMQLIAIRETRDDSERGFQDWLVRGRKILCQEEFRNDLAAGLIGVLIEPLVVSAAIPPGVATVVAIYAFKVGIKKFCESSVPMD